MAKKLYKTEPVEAVDLVRPGIRRGASRYRKATSVAEVTAGLALSVKNRRGQRASNANCTTTVVAVGVVRRRHK